jgi:hypothetical protein
VWSGLAIVGDEQGFFSHSEISTGGHQNNRLPRNFENIANFSNELIQTNFEFNFFYTKTNNIDILFAQVVITG